MSVFWVQMRHLLARPALLSFGLFVALSVVHTWPLASAPGTLSRVDNGDMLLNAWAMAWVAHQLPRDPLHLFDANIFWPERRTLAYSEHLVLQGILGMPVRALGGSPVLSHNLVMLAGFALTGWAFCLLVRRWTSSWPAGLVAGSLAAFNAHTLTRLAHVQAVHLEFFALALFALDRLLRYRRLGPAVQLGLSVALQGLTSLYLLVFAAWAMVFVGLARLDAWARPRRLRLAGLTAAAVIVAGVLSLPFVVPYYKVRQELGFSRSSRDARFYAASWEDFVSTGARVHYAAWSRRYFPRAKNATFPGVVALSLAGLALARRRGWQDGRCRMVLAMGVGGVLMSVLPRMPIYPWLHEHVPMLQVVRATSRFGILALLGLAVLAGFGVRDLRLRWRGRRHWPLVAAGLVILVNAEAFRAPLWYARFQGIPKVYETLQREPGAVVVELPLPRIRQFFGNASYMLNSTSHWRPLLNGYSGFIPPSYAVSRRAVADFPQAASLVALHALGVTHVVVHGRRFGGAYGRETLDSLDQHPALVKVAADGNIRIFRLRQ